MTDTRNSYKPRERQLHSLRPCIAAIQSLAAYQKARPQNRPIQSGLLFDVFILIVDRSLGTLRHIARLQIFHVHAAIFLRERVRGFI